MATLSAFADEVTNDFKGQIDYLVREKVGCIEIRFLDGKNIMDLPETGLKEAKQMLNDNGIRVSAIGSPIGKVPLDAPFGPHLDKFKHAVELAHFFETPFIRMFSYYAPAGKNIDDCRDQVMDRMAQKVALIENTDIVMVHENETGIYGHSAQNCTDIAETINSPKLRLVYD
ncbi:MAG: TIM barrel protein, partial [Chitinivibrionales bacterium]|nr:TIM barrel protein [Chitinivibrionales bacterium]